jgi:LAO/AO transport system kinase
MPVTRNSDPEALFRAAKAGERVALPRLLSLVEQGGPASRAVAEIAYRAPDESYSVGITGAPGAGKSTLTNQIITQAIERGFDGADRVAVLAIDPSSPFSGGAILGDRVRMQNHSLDDRVFIRSMATRGHLGGLAVAVPDALRVLSAVGLPLAIVETVGVGQQEVAVAAATDTTVVVMNPGWGDAIQANKAGLMEIADLFVINKADRAGTRETRRDLELMLDLSAPEAWRPTIVETVASEGKGVAELWDAIGEHRNHLVTSGRLEVARRTRMEREFHQVLLIRLQEVINEMEDQGSFVGALEELAAGASDPYRAADEVLVRLGVMAAPGGPGGSTAGG